MSRKIPIAENKKKPQILQNKLPRSIQVLVSSIDDHLVSYDTKWRYTFVNDAAVRVLGKSRKDLLGKSIWKLFPEAIGNQYYKDLHQAFRTKQTIISEFYYPPFNKWFENRIYPFENGVTVFSTDITTRKLAQSSLAESEERFRNMADASPILIGMGNEKGEAEYVNKPFLKFLGKTNSSVLRHGYLSVLHPDDIPSITKKYNKALRTHTAFQLEARYRRFDGKYRWLFVSAAPRFRSDGAFLGFIASHVDISDRKKLEEQKDMFVAIASHELKTPITTIKTYVHILRYRLKRIMNPSLTDVLDNIERQILVITNLINDFLNLKKIESGKIRLRMEAVNIYDIIAHVANSMQNISPKHKITVYKGSPVRITADKDRIGQVLTNVLTNAITYSPSASKIIIKTIKHDTSLTIIVKDFGIGIPKSKLKHIFTRFYRAQTNVNNNFGGLGLGLYISKEIIELHGGKIWAESTVGIGTTMHISLPIQHKSHKKLH